MSISRRATGPGLGISYTTCGVWVRPGGQAGRQCVMRAVCHEGLATGGAGAVPDHNICGALMLVVVHGSCVLHGVSGLGFAHLKAPRAQQCLVQLLGQVSGTNGQHLQGRQAAAEAQVVSGAPWREQEAVPCQQTTHHTHLFQLHTATLSLPLPPHTTATTAYTHTDTPHPPAPVPRGCRPSAPAGSAAHSLAPCCRGRPPGCYGCARSRRSHQ